MFHVTTVRIIPISKLELSQFCALLVWSPGLPTRTIARTVSSELLGFCSNFPYFLFLCRALDLAGQWSAFERTLIYRYRIVSYRTQTLHLCRSLPFIILSFIIFTLIAIDFKTSCIDPWKRCGLDECDLWRSPVRPRSISVRFEPAQRQ